MKTEMVEVYVNEFTGEKFFLADDCMINEIRIMGDIKNKTCPMCKFYDTEDDICETSEHFNCVCNKWECKYPYELLKKFNLI